jgi:hypothetical protein
VTLRTGWIIVFILAFAHLVLATLYSNVTPVLTPGRVFSQGGGQEGVQTIDIGNPDELQHIVYVARVASGEGIPKLEVGDPKIDYYYQSHQPPLYYALAAGWMKIGASGLSGFAPYIASHNGGEVLNLLKGRKWSEIGLTYDQVQSQGRFLRILNGLIGAATVVAVCYFGAFGLRSPIAGVGGAILAALLPMNVALSGAVSNDPLLFMLIAWVCALLAREITEGACWKRMLFIGLLTGLAFLTKTTALALVPVWLAAWWFSGNPLSTRGEGVGGGEDRGFGRWSLKVFAPGLILALVIGGAWWMRNISVYGEPFVLKTFNEAFQGRSPLAKDLIARVGAGAYWNAVATLTANSFVGVFSYMDIFLEEIFYRITLALLALGLLGSAFAKRQGVLESPGAARLAGVLLLVVVVLFVQFNLGFYQAQARYLIPAIAGIGALFGLGIAATGKAATRVLIAVAVWFIVLNALALQVLPAGFEARILPPT